MSAAAVESIMDVSIGSDGERSTSSMCGSPPVSPSEASPPLKLKFSIANILSPEFGKLEKESIKRPESANSIPGTPCTSLSPADLTNPKALASAMAMSRPPVLWPAWVYCTRYSDRPSSGPRCRRIKRKATTATTPGTAAADEKRPRTAFTSEQLNRLKTEFTDNRYLTEKRRQELAHELGLNESQIKIWFQNKRAKIKKAIGQRPPLALHLMAQGLYNHATVPVIEDE